MDHNRHSEPYSLYKRQTSNEELEALRKRLLSGSASSFRPHEKVCTVDELLKDIDEEVKETLRL